MPPSLLIEDGRDDSRPYRQRYPRRGGRERSDDLTGTILAGRHQPLRAWIICPDFPGIGKYARKKAELFG